MKFCTNHIYIYIYIRRHTIDYSAINYSICSQQLAETRRTYRTCFVDASGCLVSWINTWSPPTMRQSMSSLTFSSAIGRSSPVGWSRSRRTLWVVSQTSARMCCCWSAYGPLRRPTTAARMLTGSTRPCVTGSEAAAAAAVEGPNEGEWLGEDYKLTGFHQFQQHCSYAMPWNEVVRLEWIENKALYFHTHNSHTTWLSLQHNTVHLHQQKNSFTTSLYSTLSLTGHVILGATGVWPENMVTFFGGLHPLPPASYAYAFTSEPPYALICGVFFLSLSLLLPWFQPQLYSFSSDYHWTYHHREDKDVAATPPSCSDMACTCSPLTYLCK